MPPVPMPTALLLDRSHANEVRKIYARRRRCRGSLALTQPFSDCALKCPNATQPPPPPLIITFDFRGRRSLAARHARTRAHAHSHPTQFVQQCGVRSKRHHLARSVGCLVARPVDDGPWSAAGRGGRGPRGMQISRPPDFGLCNLHAVIGLHQSCNRYENPLGAGKEANQSATWRPPGFVFAARGHTFNTSAKF